MNENPSVSKDFTYTHVGSGPTAELQVHDTCTFTPVLPSTHREDPNIFPCPRLASGEMGDRFRAPRVNQGFQSCPIHPHNSDWQRLVHWLPGEEADADASSLHSFPEHVDAMWSRRLQL